jgi:glycosyltransferase involved in cell wall biosynthesis
MIKVSVIVPVYKVPLEYLRVCLDSLVAQTMQECEFIIVSDGAPEAECLVCEEYAAKDSRFKFFKREHAGVSAARNYGISHVQGEYISFVDSDDWIASTMLEEIFFFAKKNPSDIVTMDFFVSQNGKDILRKQKPKLLCAESMLRQILIGELFGGMQMRIIKKSFYDKYPIKFSEKIGYCEDVFFWVAFLQQQPRITYLNKAFYYYNQDNTASITRNYTLNKYEERKRFIQLLKENLPDSFKKEINVAAFHVKMEALRNGFLTCSEYRMFEPTHFRTLFFSKQSWFINFYSIIRMIVNRM